MIAAHIDNEGAIVGFYDSEIGVPPPDAVDFGSLVEVSHEERSLWIEHPEMRWVDGGLIDYTPPPPTDAERLAALPPVSHAQIIAALIDAEILTEAEGTAWITGTLPAAVEAMIATLPAEQRTIARLRAIRPSEVVPTDPLVTALALAQGKDEADLIDLFTMAASL